MSGLMLALPGILGVFGSVGGSVAGLVMAERRPDEFGRAMTLVFSGAFAGFFVGVTLGAWISGANV